MHAQFQNLIPFVMTVPLAMYYGLYGYFVPDYGVRTVLESNFAPGCNCSKPLRFHEAGLLSKLTEINVPHDSRIDILNMLDNLDWVQVQPPCSGFGITLEQLLDNKNELVWLLFLNSVSFLLMHALAQETIVGVMLKIFVARVWRSVRDFVSGAILASILGVKSQAKEETRVETAVTSGAESSDEEIFACSSMNLPAIQQEEIPTKRKANKDLDLYMEEKMDFDDEIEMIGAVNSLRFLTTTTPPDSEEASSSDEDGITIPSPEKFKKFLHQRHEDMEKLGIGLTDIEDGYGRPGYGLGKMLSDLRSQL